MMFEKVLALTQQYEGVRAGQQYEGVRAGLASPLFRTDASFLRFPLWA